MDPQQPAGPMSYNSGGGSGRSSLLTTVVLIVLLIAALAFGGWAFSKMQDYKNNSDKKVAAAVAMAVVSAQKDQKAKDEEAAKSPNKVFQSSPTFGSITFNYPKTWSAYVDTSNDSEPINGYFYPDQVPGTQGTAAYALRVELVSTDYSQLLQQYSSQITEGTVTASAYIPPKMQGVPNVVAGTYVKGQINQQDQTQRGSLVIIKVRDKTLQIYSESSQFSSDFNNTVLASLTFVP
jgi:hypothetical protein